MVGFFEITILPSPAEVARIIKGLGPAFRDWRPAWRTMAPAVAEGVRANFRMSGAPIGRAWAPLATATLARRARLGLSTRPGVHSGNLRAALAHGDLRLSKARFRYFTRVPYARVFQRGRRRGPPQPARAFFGWSQAMERAALRVMEMHARELIEQAARKINGLSRRAARR